MVDDEPRVTAPDPRPKLVVRKLRLVVVAGPDKGAQLVSAGQRVLIGTQPPADLVLADPKVSRLHCEIAIGDGRVVIRDEGSLNGTTVEGVVVREAELRDGQMIGVGDSRIRFELGGERQVIAVSEQARFGLLVGESLAMRAMFATLERAAASDVTVLLEGETGTGKEATAESIHEASGRRGKPLVVVDCSAIPSSLLESELFGHDKGAFTDAKDTRLGAFELAQGGTIFLDEIGELGLELQPKLLRALESREIKRVGGTHYLPIDVRVIAATNRSLRHEVNDKRFRADLYYRLAVLPIRIPPLRDRLQDVPLLVEHFIAKHGAAAQVLRVPAFLDELARHRWSGNVRELRNYLERCVALGEQPPVDDDELGGESLGGVRVDPHQPIRVAREHWMNVLERRYVEAVLELAGNNVTQAAKLAGVSRVQLWRLLQRHGVR
jgi:transcriptional regulator with GAF, ATPase, and Fis domain